DVEHRARRRRKEMQDMAMDVGEGQALVLLHEDVGRLAITFGTADGARTSRSAHESDADLEGRAPSERACLAASNAASRSANLPATGPAAAAIGGAGSVS